jgi:hypothetical protein
MSKQRMRNLHYGHTRPDDSTLQFRTAPANQGLVNAKFGQPLNQIQGLALAAAKSSRKINMGDPHPYSITV